MVLLYIAIFMELLLFCTSYGQGVSNESCPIDFMPRNCSKNLSCHCISTNIPTNITCADSKLNLFDSRTGGLICPHNLLNNSSCDHMNDCDRFNGTKCLPEIRRNRFENTKSSLNTTYDMKNNENTGNLPSCPTDFFRCHQCYSDQYCFCESLKVKLQIKCWGSKFLNLYSADTGNPVCPGDLNELFGCDESKCGTPQITTTAQNQLDPTSQPPLTSIHTNSEVTNVLPTVAGMAPTIISSTTALLELEPTVTEKSQDATNPTNSAYFALILLIIPIIVIIWIVWKKFTTRKNSEKPGGETFVMEENDVYGTIPGLNRSDAYAEENELYGHVSSAGPRVGNDDVENELYGTLG
ncbi:Hypothetical predicted protein [Cloeon dipterum]|uniref:EB domain-containing protein n=1 Tax=Cloeon dipterum TaxID=197152 RepID=A0A8S1CTN1_9INSE|nr:Hypothetical predicted protein [Cloeon dipterum]